VTPSRSAGGVGHRPLRRPYVLYVLYDLSLVAVTARGPAYGKSGRVECMPGDPCAAVAASAACLNVPRSFRRVQRVAGLSARSVVVASAQAGRFPTCGHEPNRKCGRRAPQPPGGAPLQIRAACGSEPHGRSNSGSVGSSSFAPARRCRLPPICFSSPRHPRLKGLHEERLAPLLMQPPVQVCTPIGCHPSRGQPQQLFHTPQSNHL
jgi:hypothetical protein